MKKLKDLTIFDTFLNLLDLYGKIDNFLFHPSINAVDLLAWMLEVVNKDLSHIVVNILKDSINVKMNLCNILKHCLA